MRALAVAAIVTMVGGCMSSGVDDGSGCLLVSDVSNEAEGSTRLFEIDSGEIRVVGGLTFDARFSPDDSLLAMVLWDKGVPRLSVVDEAGIERMTSDGDPAGQLAWSPSGERLAYSSIKPIGDSGASSSVWWTPTDEFDPRLLSGPPDVDSSPAWLPSGEELVVVGHDRFPGSEEGGLRIVAVATDGSARRDLDTPGVWVRERPAVSPDGTIAFVGDDQESGASGVYVLDPDGSGLRQVTTSDSGEMAIFSWSPDGSMLAVVESTGTVNMVGVIEVGTGAIRVVLDDVGRVGFPIWSPASDMLALSRSAPDEPGEDPAFDVVTVTLDGEVALAPINGLALDWAQSCDRWIESAEVEEP